MTDVGYYYYFQGRFKHTGLYKSWVEEARNAGIQMQMMTTIPLERYQNKREKIESYASEPHITVLPIPLCRRGTSIAALIYFLVAALHHDRIVVHVRKRSTGPLDLLKRILGNDRVQYIVEIEGDPKAEADYLESHPYRDGYYDDFLEMQDERINNLQRKIRSADGLLLVTETLRDLFDERYPSADVVEKASVIPSGVDTTAISFELDRRERIREELGVESDFVMTYVGGVHYSWQNAKRILELFSIVCEQLDGAATLILLVRQKDHEIVLDFANRVGIDDDQFLLREVSHEEVVDYLNAADMGILLRDDHLMNRVVTTAKLGEYLVAGLPVLTTRVAYCADAIEKRGYGIMLDDMDDDEKFRQSFNEFLESSVNRREISEWAEGIFSTVAHRETYVELLERLGEE